MSADMSKTTARLHALYDKYRGLQGDMPPFGDVIFLLDCLEAAASQQAELLAALREVAEFCESLETGYQARVVKINNDTNKGCLTVASECARFARAAFAKAEERR